MMGSLGNDFVIVQDGERLTSNNRRSHEFVMWAGDGSTPSIEASGPLSPNDVNHFEQTKSLASPKQEPAPDARTGFVLVGHGAMEASVEPLSPSDRKLYYKRQSFSSPKVLPRATDLLPPPDDPELTGAFLDERT